VAKVSSFANGPGRPSAGQGALRPRPASSRVRPGVRHGRTSQTPGLVRCKDLVLHLDSYSAALGATGYETVVTLTGTDGQQLTKAFPRSPDAWNTLTLDVSSWASRSKAARAEAGFQARGTTMPRQSRFQLDDVSWTG